MKLAANARFAWRSSAEHGVFKRSFAMKRDGLTTTRRCSMICASCGQLFSGNISVAALRPKILRRSNSCCAIGVTMHDCDTVRFAADDKTYVWHPFTPMGE